MKLQNIFRFLFITAVLSLTVHSPILSQTPEYDIRRIDEPGAYMYGGVNDSSVVVGGANRGSFIWRNGVVTLLPRGTTCNYWIPRDLNNQGVAAGCALDCIPDPYRRAIRWTETGYIDIGSLMNNYESDALGINSDGKITGFINLPPGGPDNVHAFIYDGSLHLLNVPYSFGYSINDSDYVVGQYGIVVDPNTTIWKGFLYRNGSYIELPGFGLATDINNRNQVIGIDAAAEPGTGLLWENGNVTTLGGVNVFPLSINDSGTVVGIGFNSVSGVRGALRWKNGEVSQLNDLIPPNSGADLWRALCINNKGEILCFGKDITSGVYYYYLLTHYTPALTIRDAKNDTIPNVEFDLIKVANNPPFFTEDTLGLFTTDSDGRLELTKLPPDTFSVELSTGTKQLVGGDSLKIAKKIYTQPTVKHSGVLGTMYSIYLDNAKFDSVGAMSFDKLNSDGVLEVTLDHTELRYNLLVSVEWDAALSYLTSLEAGFRAMSNYLYDVSDGQIRLDTVMIYDNKEHWDKADMRIYASNIEWPRATAAGINSSGSEWTIFFPRKWFGNPDACRNGSYGENPLNLEDDYDFRTKCHEMGHYAFNYYDEYKFSDGSGGFVDEMGRCGSIANYGYMDHQFESGGEWSSEMSSIYRYQDAECQNTKQFILNYGSCWDYLEEQFEKEWGTNSIFVPIITPDDAERKLMYGFEYLPGPNGEMFVLDYDVGALVKFPEQPFPPDPDIATLNVQVENATNRIAKADVTLINNYFSLNPKNIYQGQTDDGHGSIWVVGASKSNRLIQASAGQATVLAKDFILAKAPVNKVWLCGEASVGGPKEKRVNNNFWGTEDSLTIELRQVAGDYPLICGMSLGDKTATYQLNILNTFSANPTIELFPDAGGQYTDTFTYDGTKYTAQVSDTLSNSGMFTIWAKDDSAQNFFFNTDYTVIQFDTSAVTWNLIGPQGGAEVWIDTLNSVIQKGMILSSPYLIIRTGLDTVNIQAGEAHSFSVYPPTSLAGNNRIIIRYADSDLDIGNGIKGKESSLKIFHWDEGSNQWEQISGTVDTIQNQVSTTITALGVYGAFTTELLTSVKDEGHGSVIPEKFELKQNYPNPFNPICNIEYSLPKSCKVTLVIYNILGQKVRVLVDEYQSAGYKHAKWDGRDDLGREVTSGIYFYRIKAGDSIQAKKMILVR